MALETPPQARPGGQRALRRSRAPPRTAAPPWGSDAAPGPIARAPPESIPACQRIVDIRDLEVDQRWLASPLAKHRELDGIQNVSEFAHVRHGKHRIETGRGRRQFASTTCNTCHLWRERSAGGVTPWLLETRQALQRRTSARRAVGCSVKLGPTAWAGPFRLDEPRSERSR